MDWDAFIRTELDAMVPYAPGLRSSEVRERSGKDRILKLSSNEHPCGPVPERDRGDGGRASAPEPLPGRRRDGAARRLCETARCTTTAPRRSATARTSCFVSSRRRCSSRATRSCSRGRASSSTRWSLRCSARPPSGSRSAEGDVHDLDAMLAAITESTRLVFLCNPNNPTGTIYDATQFERFLGAVPDHVLVVVDEAYFEYVTARRLPERARRTSTASARSSCCGPSRRSTRSPACGSATASLPEPLAPRVDKVREPFNVNTVAQVGAYYSLADDAEVERRRRREPGAEDLPLLVLRPAWRRATCRRRRTSSTS